MIYGSKRGGLDDGVLESSHSYFLIFPSDEWYIFSGKGHQRLSNLCEVFNEDAQNTTGTKEATYLVTVWHSGQSWIFCTFNCSGIHPSMVHICPTMLVVGAAKTNLDAETVNPTISYETANSRVPWYGFVRAISPLVLCSNRLGSDIINKGQSKPWNLVLQDKCYVPLEQLYIIGMPHRQCGQPVRS